MCLQAAYANFHTEQESVYFMQRYHDVIYSFGGRTSYAADNRPLLVMRSNLWGSGYDVHVYFFFQAEDGIRDVAVTGVQTCALPISAKCVARGDSSRGLPVPGSTVLRSGNRLYWPAFRLTVRRLGSRQVSAARGSTKLSQIGRASCRERV